MYQFIHLQFGSSDTPSRYASRSLSFSLLAFVAQVGTRFLFCITIVHRSFEINDALFKSAFNVIVRSEDPNSVYIFVRTIEYQTVVYRMPGGKVTVSTLSNPPSE